MPNLLYQQNIISVADLSVVQLQLLLDTALKLKHNLQDKLLDGKIIASCFFEPSTRTRLSFETAVQRLGGKVIGFADGANTSAKKGETLADTARIISNYADAIIQRHPKDGAARVLAEFSRVHSHQRRRWHKSAPQPNFAGFGYDLRNARQPARFKNCDVWRFKIRSHRAFVGAGVEAISMRICIYVAQQLGNARLHYAGIGRSSLHLANF